MEFVVDIMAREIFNICIIFFNRDPEEGQVKSVPPEIKGQW